MGVAVAVRVDRAVEAGDQLVGARVDDAAALGVGLPAGDADREDGRARRHPVQAAGPAGADEQPGHLRSVPLHLGRLLRARPGVGRGGAVDEVETGIDATVEVRLRPVDAGVEQRDREAAAVVAG